MTQRFARFRVLAAAALLVAAAARPASADSAAHIRQLDRMMVSVAKQSARDAAAIVLQRPVLLRRSVRANLAYPLRLRGLSRSEVRQRSGRVLAAANLEALAERPARRLSVGEQQRVALAQAWVREPEVLLLDEPAAALDPGATSALEAAIGRLAREGVKVVMATHDLAQARRMADEILFLHGGRLLEQTPAAEFFRSPRSAEARRFLEGGVLA